MEKKKAKKAECLLKAEELKAWVMAAPKGEREALCLILERKGDEDAELAIGMEFSPVNLAKGLLTAFRHNPRFYRIVRAVVQAEEEEEGKREKVLYN